MLSTFSADFVNDFFPGLHKLLFDVADRVDYQLITCHGDEPIHEFLGIEIRNLSLLPTQIAGILIGLYGASKIKNQSWFYAFLYFAGMNFTSIFCHNLTEKYTFEWELFRLLDIVFTGSSAACLLFSQFEIPSIVNIAIFPILLGLNYKYDFGTPSIPFLPEFTYIGLMIIAVLFLLPNLRNIGTSTIGYGLSVTGLLLLLAGLPIDSILCQFSTQLASVHLIFLGSDFCLLGLFMLANSPRQKKKLE